MAWCENQPRLPFGRLNSNEVSTRHRLWRSTPLVNSLNGKHTHILTCPSAHSVENTLNALSLFQDTYYKKKNCTYISKKGVCKCVCMWNGLIHSVPQCSWDRRSSEGSRLYYAVKLSANRYPFTGCPCERGVCVCATFLSRSVSIRCLGAAPKGSSVFHLEQDSWRRS